MIDEKLIQKYAASMRQMELLDRDYSRKRNPSLAERAAYYRRKQRAEEMRTRFYAAIEESRSMGGRSWRPPTDDKVAFHRGMSLAVH
jgi:hypothetical protein